MVKAGQNRSTIVRQVPSIAAGSLRDKVFNQERRQRGKVEIKGGQIIAVGAKVKSNGQILPLILAGFKGERRYNHGKFHPSLGDNGSFSNSQKRKKAARIKITRKKILFLVTVIFITKARKGEDRNEISNRTYRGIRKAKIKVVPALG